jgi:hypothetical protein
VFVHRATNAEYALIAGDLMRAREFLGALRDCGPNHSKVIREALTLAAIVAYCRPFKPSYNAADQKRRWIPQELIDDLPVARRSIHERMVWARDKAWAHTDWAAHTPRSCEEPGVVPVVLSRNPWVPLSPSEIDELEHLVDEVDAPVKPLSAIEE